MIVFEETAKWVGVGACCHAGCGVVFALEAGFYENRRRDHIDFFCPNGHAQHYSQESDVERLQKEVQRERAAKDQALADARYQRERLNAADLSRRALRGVIKRTKNRVGHGVCPCCHRSFTALRRHMATKHPEYAKAWKVES